MGIWNNTIIAQPMGFTHSYSHSTTLWLNEDNPRMKMNENVPSSVQTVNSHLTTTWLNVNNHVWNAWGWG